MSRTFAEPPADRPADLPADRPADGSAASPARIPVDVATEIDALFAGAVQEHRTAGITWAIIGGHDDAQAVLASGAAGSRELAEGFPAEGSAPMDTATISRIASMTKSFTAASVLRLRDEDRLHLDDAVAEHLPEARGITPATPDSPVITLRDLLSMSAGLVTDNPWGDRQEAMTREAFADLLGADLGFVHAPGTGFEYSNTGFAMLGRIIDEVSGTPYTEYIARTFLRPLGMADSAFDVAEVDRARLATGHRIADREDATRFEPVPLDSPGVYGAMAGLFSTTADIARWVRFLAAADAPDAADRSQELLVTASRREMQQMHRIQPTPPLPAGPDGLSPGFDRVRGYGFGLVIERFPDLGEIVSHSGGYPGYGSFMCWHRDSGIGVVALANAKYAPASTLSMQVMRLLASRTELLRPRRAQPAPRAAEAAEQALAYLGAPEPNPEIAAHWFADNMDLDVPPAERLRRRDAALAAAGLELGAIAALGVADAEAVSRAHLRWRVPGIDAEHPGLQIDLLLDPRREALLQALDVTSLERA